MKRNLSRVHPNPNPYRCEVCGYRVDLTTVYAERAGGVLHLACATDPKVLKSRVSLPELDEWVLRHTVK